MQDMWPLLGLWLSGFVSATVLPGNSEIALALYLKTQIGAPWLVVGIVTCGNMLGGMTTVLLGRAAPSVQGGPWLQRLQRYGPVMTILTPLPLVGDLIAAAAGWLRLPLWPVAGWMLLGRAGRYVFLAWALS